MGSLSLGSQCWVYTGLQHGRVPTQCENLHTCPNPTCIPPPPTQPNPNPSPPTQHDPNPTQLNASPPPQPNTTPPHLNVPPLHPNTPHPIPTPCVPPPPPNTEVLLLSVLLLLRTTPIFGHFEHVGRSGVDVACFLDAGGAPGREQRAEVDPVGIPTQGGGMASCGASTQHRECQPQWDGTMRCGAPHGAEHPNKMRFGNANPNGMEAGDVGLPTALGIPTRRGCVAWGWKSQPQRDGSTRRGPQQRS